MLARTDPAIHQRPEHPDQQADADAPSRTPPKLHLEGDEDAGRALTVDFSAMVQALKSIPDPDPRADAYYAPGLDLLHALYLENDDFVEAAPGVDAAAPLAEQVMALTDEAFHKAHTVLEALGEGLPPSDEEPTPHFYMLMARLGSLSPTPDMRRIFSIAPTADPKIGSEFY